MRTASPVANFHDLLLDAVCMVDAGGRFVYVSAAFEAIFGYSPAEVIGMKMIDLVAPADRERTLAEAQNVMSGQSRVGFENRYLRKDGAVVHIMWSARWSEADQLRVAVARDVSAKKQAEAKQAALFAMSEAAHSTTDLAELYRSTHDVIGGLLPAAGFTVALHNDGGSALRLVYHADDNGDQHAEFAQALCEEVLRRKGAIRLAPGEPADFLAPSRQAQAGSAHWLGVPLITPEKTIGALMLRSAATESDYSSESQDLLHFAATQIVSAIQRKQLHDGLQFMALHDDLTGLANRRLFHDRLEGALRRCQRQKTKLSLLFIDLNKFKQVNDQHGHVAGDGLLQEVARRLRGCVRESDSVARIGGDEFVVILENVAKPEHAMLVCDKINHDLVQPIGLPDGRSFSISASIGVAHYPEDGTDVQKLLRHADRMMYSAKLGAASAAK